MAGQMTGVLGATISKALDKPVKSVVITPKGIDVDFNRPLREHLDNAAVQRGWMAYKLSTFKKSR